MHQDAQRYNGRNIGGGHAAINPSSGSQVRSSRLDRSTGTLNGIITEQTTNFTLPDVWVVAIGPNGPAGGAVTATGGTFTIDNLPPGTYRAAIIDPTANHTLEYYNNSADFFGATAINITANSSTGMLVALAQT